MSGFSPGPVMKHLSGLIPSQQQTSRFTLQNKINPKNRLNEQLRKGSTLAASWRNIVEKPNTDTSEPINPQILSAKFLAKLLRRHVGEKRHAHFRRCVHECRKLLICLQAAPVLQHLVNFPFSTSVFQYIQHESLKSFEFLHMHTQHRKIYFYPLP